MNLEKLEKLVSLAEKYDYKPDESHFNNLAAFVGINSSLIADLCKEYTTLQREITNAQEALKSAGIEADTVQAGVMELVSKLAEMQKQKPVAYVMGEETIDDFNRGYEFFAVRDAEHEEEMDNIPLFARPAPAIDLAELVPNKWYFQLTFGIPNLDGMTPYQAHGAAWEQCRAAILRNIEVAGNAGKDGSHE